jgi:L-seryl-tRNA(Ser) seleniumtransferase
VVVGSIAQVGGGGAPGVELPSAAVGLPETCAVPLRRAGIVGRVESGRLLLDLRGIPVDLDVTVLAARIRESLQCM